ncbi:MAG TPA: STAS domain-containing protein [Pseudomonadales bacterium]
MSNEPARDPAADRNGTRAGGSDYRLSGRVQFSNFMKYREEGEAAIEAAANGVVIDLSGLENGSSVAVALLTAWYRAAEQRGKSIRFVGVPVDLQDIIDLSGLTEVLPLDEAGAEPAAEEGR